MGVETEMPPEMSMETFKETMEIFREETETSGTFKEAGMEGDSTGPASTATSQDIELQSATLG